MSSLDQALNEICIFFMKMNCMYDNCLNDLCPKNYGLTLLQMKLEGILTLNHDILSASV